MKVLGAVVGGTLLSGIAAVFGSVASMEHGEITKERMALAMAGLLIMGVGVVEANMYFGMYRTLETKEGMRERFYGLGMPKNTDEERKVLLLEELDELAEYYIVHYDLEMLSNIALLRRQAKELFVELGVA